MLQLKILFVFLTSVQLRRDQILQQTSPKMMPIKYLIAFFYYIDYIKNILPIFQFRWSSLWNESRTSDRKRGRGSQPPRCSKWAQDLMMPEELNLNWILILDGFSRPKQRSTKPDLSSVRWFFTRCFNNRIIKNIICKDHIKYKKRQSISNKK